MPSNDSETGAMPIDVEQLRVSYSVYYGVARPDRDHGRPPALIFAAHGYGQSCKSFLRTLEPLRKYNFLIIAPQGPNQFYWQDSGKVGFCWMTRYGRENTIVDLMAYMRALKDDVHARYEFDHDRVFILGFSQGTALAFRFASEGILEPRGVIACGADLPPDVADRLGEIVPYPVYVVHGKNDSTMNFAKGQEGADTLRAAGFDVETLYFDGEHDLPAPVLESITDWIHRH